MSFPFSKLTFYLNNNELTLVYYNYLDSRSNRKLIIPPYKLQKSLSL